MRTLGVLLGLLVRLYLKLLRIEILNHSMGTNLPGLPFSILRGEIRQPLVYVFWHGSQLALLARPRRRPTAVLVSLSRDGELQSGVMSHHGMVVVRGSTSRRAASGLRGLLRELGKGRDAAFAVDGPRGPLRRCKPGALLAAKRAGALVVPLGVAADRAWVLTRAWDQFLIPKPFARVVIAVGEPMEPTTTSAIERAIDQMTAMASISRRAPLGSAETCTVARAGNTPSKRRA